MIRALFNKQFKLIKRSLILLLIFLAFSSNAAFGGACFGSPKPTGEILSSYANLFLTRTEKFISQNGCDGARRAENRYDQTAEQDATKES